MKKQIIFATLFTGGVFCTLFGGFMGFGVPYDYGVDLEFWRMLFSVGLGAAALGIAGLIK